MRSHHFPPRDYLDGRFRPHSVAAIFGLLLMVVRPVSAQDGTDPLRFLSWPVHDAAGLVGDFGAPDLVRTAGVGAALVFLSRYDATLTEHSVGVTRGMHVKIVEEFGNAKVVRPAAMVIFAGALLSGDHRFQDAAFTSLESVIFANLVTDALKSAVGRARPYEGDRADAFAPFSGSHSFPSGHATTAFSFLAPWFFYYPGPMTGGLLVLATTTAFSRMATNQHWFTDVVAGSAIGFFTAYALSRRHARGPAPRLTPRLGPAGVTLEYRF